MQPNRTALPTVTLNPRLQRKVNPDSKSITEESRTHSKSAFLLPNKKQLRPLNGTPYKTSGQAFLYPNQNNINTKQCSKSAFVQRIVSAKMLRIKALQNQLTDAHYHLNELANENKLLKTLQKRQDTALRQYEGTNAELPRIINSHHEELRAFQSKYKKLRIQHRSTCEMLKEKEMELNAIQTQNKHLLQLSKDRSLEERETLQMKVSDLNYKINQQDETIKTLNRKLAVETKYLKHQLHLEVSKHKETQKRLQETLEKIKTVEDLLGNKSRRLLHNKQSSGLSKIQNLRGQSQSSLDGNGSDTNIPRSNSKSKIIETGIEDKSQTILANESNDSKFESTWNLQNRLSRKSETMENLQHLRNFRLQKTLQNKRTSLDGNVELDHCKDNFNSFSKESSNFDQLSKSSFTHQDKVKEDIFVSENTGKDEQKLFLQEVPIKFPSSQSLEQCSRLTNNAEENFDIVKDALNLERKKNSLTIEDVDKLISQHLRVTEVSIPSNSIATLSQSLKYAINNIENNFQLRSEDSSKILFLNPELNKSSSREGYSTLESSENSQNSETEENSNQINRDDTLSEKQLFSNSVKSETQKSSDSLDSVEAKQKLSIKHSISEESEPEAFVEINNESGHEKSLESTSRSEDQRKHNQTSQTNVKESSAMNINYNKEKLLAAMKAIDDNENFEFVGHTSRKNIDVKRSLVTEVVHKGLPTHLRKKDIIRELFENEKSDQPKT